MVAEGNEELKERHQEVAGQTDDHILGDLQDELIFLKAGMLIQIDQ